MIWVALWAIPAALFCHGWTWWDSINRQVNAEMNGCIAGWVHYGRTLTGAKLMCLQAMLEAKDESFGKAQNYAQNEILVALLLGLVLGVYGVVWYVRRSRAKRATAVELESGLAQSSGDMSQAPAGSVSEASRT